MLTKTSLLATYRSNLLAYHGPTSWVHDPAKLDKFMADVEATVRGPKNLVTFDLRAGSALMAAWRSLGGKGKPTYKALRALPDGDA
jgi:hypothetical protein